MNRQKLKNFFDTRCAQGTPLVMATVYATEGSTYSKAGARMLVDADGIFQGMLSGGCLEGDLAIRAQLAIESGQVQFAHYNLADSDDDLWGLGVGCDGVMQVFLQPLTVTRGYEPFASLLETEIGRRRALYVTVIESKLPTVSAGASMLYHPGKISNFGVEPALAAALEPWIKSRYETEFEGLQTVQVQDSELRLLASSVHPVPRLIVLGGGLDAEPVVNMASELGWIVTVADHRPAYLENNRFESAERIICSVAEQISDELDFDDFDLAIVMSHHLASDRSYLAQLALSDVGYIGLLGPRGRRRRLLDELGQRADDLRGRLHGPAGLDLGGRGPAAIALSIVAQMQQYLTAD